MKTWQTFNDAVIDMLLTDGIRRGRGVEKYRDRMIVAGVRDLQRNIPELRSTPATKSWGQGELTEHSDKQCEVGDFDYEATRVLDLTVRRIPTTANAQTASVYYRPTILPGWRRFEILDGGGHSRTASYPGRVSFALGKIYSEPALREDESLSILYNAEVNYKPLFECSANEKAEVTPFTDDAALAVHHYVNYNFSKDVDDNQKMATTNFELFKSVRRSIFANRKEYSATSSPTEAPIGTGAIPSG